MNEMRKLMETIERINEKQKLDEYDEANLSKIYDRLVNSLARAATTEALQKNPNAGTRDFSDAISTYLSNISSDADTAAWALYEKQAYTRDRRGR